MENATLGSNPPSDGNKARYVNLKFKKPRPLFIVIGIVIIVIILILIFAKGLFVAASVNGSSISRWSVVKELEKQGGKQVIEEMVSKKIVETELNKQEISVTKEEIDTEIKKIEERFATQGGTLSEILAQQGMTEEGLREQITTQKKLEKLLADKAIVTDAEIDAYIKETKATAPKDMTPADFRIQISDQLKQQKFGQEAQKWVADLTAKAKIKYYVKY